LAGRIGTSNRATTTYTPRQSDWNIDTSYHNLHSARSDWDIDTSHHNPKEQRKEEKKEKKALSEAANAEGASMPEKPDTTDMGNRRPWPQT